MRNRLSAGRVQSVALRLIMEREDEIDNFVPVEYWSIDAEFLPDGKPKDETFKAKLAKIDGEDPVLGSEEVVTPIVADMEATEYAVSKVKLGQRKRRPPAPFHDQHHAAGSFT